MTKRKSDFTLPTLDDLFTTQAERDDAKLERVKNIPLDKLHPFKNHPFKILNNEEMERMIESIRKVGTITPALARPLPDGGYELISGHRRLAACQVLGIETMPVIIREMSDDEAVIAMVDANLQRETILPSEKAFAYKMKLEAIKHQGVASGQLVQKWSRDKMADESSDSGRQMRTLITAPKSPRHRQWKTDLLCRRTEILKAVGRQFEIIRFSEKWSKKKPVNALVYRLCGGELGIRTLGSLWEHSISSAAPSTSRTTLRVYISIRFFLRSNFGQKIFGEKSRREH